MTAEQPFFASDETSSALAVLSEANSITLYCGAGVTRDQTGLGWDALVAAVYEAARPRRKADLAVHAAVLHLISNPALSAQQKASIVVERLKPSRLSEDEFLTRHLSKILYSDRGWGEGHLLRSIAEYAIVCSSLGRRVSIVTTNYDDYVLDQIVSLLTAPRSHLRPLTQTPSVIVRILGRRTPVYRFPGTNPDASIEVCFVHGVVPNSSGILSAVDFKSNIVFSEQSYAITQRRTTAFLKKRLDEDDAFVVLGASLSDPPLIEALVRSDLPNGRSFALLDLPHALNPDVDDDSAAAVAHQVLGERAKHIGISPLAPANFGQVAQFIEELRVSTVATAIGSDPTYDAALSYGKRLSSWWNSWSTSDEYKDHSMHHSALSSVLEYVKSKLVDAGCPPDVDELLRVELWMRLDPSISRNHRTLTLFANSSGPILDEKNRREEGIKRVSAIASMRAFVQGKPQITRLDELGHVQTASRWRTFMCAPVFHEVAAEAKSTVSPPKVVSVSGRIPVGVISLSSSFGSPIGDACFTDAKLSNEDYSDLLDKLTGAAGLIAAPGPK